MKHVFKPVVLSCASLLTFQLTSCTSGIVKEEARAQTNLKGREYNSVSQSYMTRPTSISYKAMASGQNALEVVMDNYGTARTYLWFYEEKSAESIAAINKFLKWEKIARSSGDQLTKEITRVKQPLHGNQSYTFHSGNKQNHLLGVSWVSNFIVGEMESPSIYFNKYEALELKRLLGNYKTSDAATTSKYN